MTKKLYRDDINGKFLGVCAGIGDYFGIDPTIIRVIWAIAFFAYGAGLWIYLIMGAVLPKKSMIVQLQKRHEEFEYGSGFDTSSAYDVEARSASCGCEDPNRWDNASSGSGHGRSSAQYDEKAFWDESRKHSDGE